MAGVNDRFRVDLELLDESVSAMHAFASEVDAILADIDHRIAALHLGWDGQAAGAQRQAHQEWMAGVKQMREDLDDLRAIARTAHANYTAAVHTNTRMWP